MRKWLGAVAVAAVLTAGGSGARPASADNMNMGPGATCSPSGTALALTAQDHKFDKDCLAVPAGQAFTIRFDNRDNDRHNMAILPSHTSTETMFAGDIVPGPKTVTYSVQALKPGTFHFHCQIHPNLMNGTFIVAAPAAPAPAPMPAPTPAPAAKPGPTPPPRMSMGNSEMPSATPAPAPAAPTPKAAASAPTAPAPKAATPTTPAPARTAASASPAPRTAAAAGKALPRTGPASNRLLLLLAGVALATGGLSVVAGARRARPCAS